jgi:hypothetical protein
MKVFWVLAWDQYYPGGGLRNVESTWETFEEAQARVNELDADPKCYFDYIEIEDISDMIGE